MTRRILEPDWRDARWLAALEAAIRLYPPERAGEERYGTVRWDGYAVLVRCLRPCWGDEHWHRVEWAIAGLTCECSSPCVHRARAWAELFHDWPKIKTWARWFGPTGAVAGVVWAETGDLEASRARDPYDVRIVRDPDGTVREASGRGWPIQPTGRFASQFSIGYSGWGPNELAYAVLATFYGPTLAEERRRNLVEWLARLPLDASEITIPAAVIRDAAADALR
jgi:hypothetical protein